MMNKALNFISENNIQPEVLFALVEQVQKMDLNDESNIRKIIKSVSQMANRTIDKKQEEFWNKYNLLEQRYEKAKARVEELQITRKEREQKLETIGGFMFEIHERDDSLDAFDERLWCVTVEKMQVQNDGKFTIVFKNGLEIVV